MKKKTDQLAIAQQSPQKVEDLIAALKIALQPGTVVYTVLRHTTASRITRLIDLYVIQDNQPVRLTWSIARALNWIYDRKREALQVEGCGMDMGWYTVRRLGGVILEDEDALVHRWL